MRAKVSCPNSPKSPESRGLMLASPRIPPKFLLIGLLGGLAIIGMIAIAIITREGSRITPDSVVYVSTARSFMGAAIPQLSTGLFVPAAHFPPLYPALLALAATLTATDPLVAARLLDIFFFGITLALVGGMTYQFTRKVWVAGLTVFFVLSQPQMLRHFGTNASEPLFIVCLLAMLWLLLEERILWAALFAALAFLTRYIGIALIAAGVCGLLLFSAYNWRLRFRKAAVFGVIGITPTLLWLVYNLSVTGKLANRSLALHLIEFHPIPQRDQRPERLVFAGYSADHNTRRCIDAHYCGHFSDDLGSLSTQPKRSG